MLGQRTRYELDSDEGGKGRHLYMYVAFLNFFFTTQTLHEQ